MTTQTNSKNKAGGNMLGETALMWVKAGGAALGSSIAIVFRPGGDPPLKLFQRFLIGTIIGFIAAPPIRTFFEWPMELDYWMASATLGGLIGYLFLQWLFSRETFDWVQRRRRK